eukprot:194014_1
MQCLEPPCKLTKSSPVCMYYYSKHDQKEYIVLTPSSEDTNKCYKYDILKNEWIHFCTYPDTIKAVCHSAAIDQETEILYIVYGHNSIFGIYDMVNNFWTVQSVANCNGGAISNAPSIILPNSDLHIVGQPNASTTNIHVRYDSIKKQFINTSLNGIDNHSYLETDTLTLVNNNNKHMMMILGGYNDDGFTDKIWYTPYTASRQNDFIWHEFAISLPSKSSPLCTVVFGSVIIIYYNIDNSSPKMAILDCSNTQQQFKWISPILDEKLITDDVTSIVATHSNYLHFINPYKEIHYKVHLQKFIPKNIYRKYVREDNIDDSKCSTCSELKEKLKTIEIEKISLQSLVDDLLNSQNNIKQKYELKINNLMGQNDKLNEECKETKLELFEVKKELNKLKRLKNIDLTNYLNWTADDIVDWISTLEKGKYEKYEDELRVKFNEECVDGNAIQYINTLELKGWGVAHFMDRTNLHKHFRQLILVNQNKAEGQDNEPGDDISTPYIH